MPLYVLSEPNTKLDPIAQGFLENHLNASSIRGKIQEKQRQLAEAKGKLDAEILNVAVVLDILEYVKSTKEEDKYIFDKTVARNDALKPLATREKSYKKTIAMVLDAAETLARLTHTIKADMAKLKNAEGRDVSVEAEIKYAKGLAMGEVASIRSFFQIDANQVKVKITKVAPEAPVDFPVLVEFDKGMTQRTSDITAIPSQGNGVTLAGAQQEIDRILKEMTTFRQQKTKELQEFAESSVFTNYLDNSAMMAKVTGMLDMARPWIEKAINWESPSAKTFADQEKQMRADVPDLFKGRDGLAQTEIAQLEKDQQQMLSDATKLRVAVQNEVDKQSLAFTTEQSRLMAEVVSLETRMKKLIGIFGPSTQMQVILDFVATTRLSVGGVNGFNSGALKTAEKLIEEAKTMVLSAEGLSAINKEINANISGAIKICNARSSESKHPLALDFVDLLKSVEEFKTDFKEQIPKEAKATSAEWLAKVTQKALDDDAVIKRRAEVAIIIGNVDKDLERLNAKFLEVFANDPNLAGKLDRGYSGALKAELETCRSWNASKTDIAFYDTIVGKLATLAKQIDEKIAHMDRASKVSMDQAMLNALAIKAEFDKTVQDLQKNAGKNGIDGDALREAMRLRDEKYAENNVLIDMKAEFNGQIAAEENAFKEIEHFVEEAKTYIAEIKDLRKKEGKDSPINYYGSEVDREMERLKLTLDKLSPITSIDKMKKAKGIPTGASALSELNFIKKYMQQIWDRGSPTDKSDLAKIKGQWDQEVQKFTAAKDKLIEAIAAFEQQDGVNLGSEASTKLTKLLNIIVDSISGNGFKGPAEVLGNANATASDRKKAREEALAEVRRLRLVMLNDPIFKKCVLNPFKVGGFGGTAQNRLEEIELNVLRGV